MIFRMRGWLTCLKLEIWLVWPKAYIIGTTLSCHSMEWMLFYLIIFGTMLLLSNMQCNFLSHGKILKTMPSFASSLASSCASFLASSFSFPIAPHLDSHLVPSFSSNVSSTSVLDLAFVVSPSYDSTFASCLTPHLTSYLLSLFTTNIFVQIFSSNATLCFHINTTFWFFFIVSIFAFVLL